MLYYVMTIFPRLNSSSVLFIYMALVQGRLSVNVGLYGTILALADTNRKNRTEQSVEMLWKCKLSVIQQGVLKPYWFE